MFRAAPLPFIRSFPLYIRHWYMSCRFDDSFQTRLVMLESCHQTCMTYSSAECTVENSWRWAEELPETCRFLTIQNYQRDALNIIYLSNIITLLYMFRVSSTHLQEDTVVYKQHMVPSLSIRVPSVLLICSYRENCWRWVLDTRNM